LSNKARPWHKVKADYLLGYTPKELEEKYCIPREQIYNKGFKYKWTNEKAQQTEVILHNHKVKIDGILIKSLNNLERIITTSTNDRDIISAAKLIIDMSGLKKVSIDTNLTSEKEITFNVIRNIISPTK